MGNMFSLGISLCHRQGAVCRAEHGGTLRIESKRKRMGRGTFGYVSRLV